MGHDFFYLPFPGCHFTLFYLGAFVIALAVLLSF